MIQEIEKLRAELDLLRLVDLEVLLQHQVEVNQVGTTEASNLGIAEAVSGLLAGSQGRGDERCLVHPAIQSLMPRVGAAIVLGLRRSIEREVLRVGDLIRAIAEATRSAEVG